MKKILVVGGGIAGLSVSVFLSKHNFEITLAERTIYLGGRARAYKDSSSGDYYDNGQHLLIGAYKNTLEFLEIIGARSNFTNQDKLIIPFALPDRRIINFKLSSSKNIIKKIYGILNLKSLSLLERVSVFQLLNRVRTLDSNKFLDKSIVEFLMEQKQSLNTIKRFWDIIAISTLNCSPTKASAKMFIDVLQAIFFLENNNSNLIFPEHDLYNSYIKQSENYLKNSNVQVRHDTSISSITLSSNEVIDVQTKDGEKLVFDYYIFAVPANELLRIFRNSNCNEFDSLDDFDYSPIVSIHIWLKENPFDLEFYSLVESPIQWIFNKGHFIAIVISNASDLVKKSKEEILEICKTELKRYFNFFDDFLILKSIVIKEKKATFVPDKKSYGIRSSQKTKFKNLFLAGDWTMTNLPATLESAVTSAKICTDLILERELHQV
ncbi:MAG: hydroxysqualene dehydroxylase HpnE [Ignavibacteria bacterium]|nr:hydroxysqualene dehydroxylase HpnE [Ignavibacteria bacterium]